MSLLDHIDKRDKYCENDVAMVIETTLKALAFIHEKGHVHGDIRPDNIYLNSEADLDKVKLFGISPGNDSVARFGSVHYCPPEGRVEGEHSSKRDLWAAGAMAYFLMSGMQLFEDDSDKNVMALVKEAEDIN